MHSAKDARRIAYVNKVPDFQIWFYYPIERQSPE